MIKLHFTHTKVFFNHFILLCRSNIHQQIVKYVKPLSGEEVVIGLTLI